MGRCCATRHEPSLEASRTGKFVDRTRARHAHVHRLLAESCGYLETAAALGLSRNTVRRFARAASPKELPVNDGTGRQAGILDGHADHPRERWNADSTNAARPGQEALLPQAAAI